MTPSRSNAPTEDDQRDFNAMADELYALRPDAFAAARDEQVRKARAEGRRGLASQLGALRRPTQSAWLINLLWRDQHDVIEELLSLGDELRRAQAAAAGPELRTLTEQRREVEGALLRRARELAEQAGVEVSASQEREAQDTLAAALAQPDVADEVRSGRLVKPVAYAGFGTLPPTPAPKPEKPAVEATEKVIDLATAQQARQSAQTEQRRHEAQRQADERARQRREAAQRRLEEARAAALAASEALDEAIHAAETAGQRQRELQEQVQRLRGELGRLERELETAERAAVAANRARDQAARVNEASARAVERAEQDLAAAKD